MKLKRSKILDYLDDQLDHEESNRIEATLGQRQEEADAAEDARLAMYALHLLAAEEPPRVSEDFWPRLREQLPQQPSRNPLSHFTSTASHWLWPSASKWAVSLRVALLVAFLAMASLWFGPQRTVTPSSAVSTSEAAFITRSMQRHEDYVNTPPSVNSLPLPVGDAGSADQDSQPQSDNYIP